jgi:hypothetical protein
MIDGVPHDAKVVALSGVDSGGESSAGSLKEAPVGGGVRTVSAARGATSWIRRRSTRRVDGIGVHAKAT